mgnify:CR=1 FL=1
MNALVTGGSRGIGRAICVRLAQLGYHVIINYQTNAQEAEKTLELVHQAGSTGELMPFDVSDRDVTMAALSAWKEAHHPEYIEVLVNNAGIRRDSLLIVMKPEAFDQVITTNLMSFYNVTRPLLNDMLLHHHGRIVNIASLSGIKGIAGQCNYSAAKGGLIAATKALAQELARKNITVNAVAPGFIRTDMTEGLDEAALKKQIPANRFGTPEEVAHAVAFLVSQEAGYITGNVISINGGLYT